MDHDNVGVVRAFYQAVQRGDYPAVRRLLDPKVEWIEPAAKALWFAGTHRGPDAVIREVIESTAGRVARFHMEMKLLLPIGDHVIAVGRLTGCCRATLKELNTLAVHLWTLHHDQVVRFEALYDEAKWLQALGEIKGPMPKRAAA